MIDAPFIARSGEEMDRSSLRPLVGISSCLKENGRGGWHHTVGEKYVRAAIHAVGGLPILIPAIGPEFGEETATIEALDRLIDSLDGVLLTGSPSNVEPHHYEGEDSRPGTAHDPARDATTLPLIRHSIDRGVPLFAICRGLQEVNVALGGSLHQLVHEVEGRRDHRSPKSPDTDVNYAPAHDIDIVEGGMLHRLLGERRVKVNSLHAQGVDRLAPRARLEAVADDGQVEAFSVPDAPAFALALQWHPEHRALENPVSMKLFDAFAAACRSRAAARLGIAAARRRGVAMAGARHPQQRAPRLLRAHRRAFDGAVVGIAAPARAAGAGAQIPAGALGLRQGAAVPDGIGIADHRQGSGAPRADPREPGDAGQRLHHAFALCRPAAHPAGRGGAQPPPHPVGAALHRRGRGRLHRRRRRAHDHARGRFRHHADLDLARSRQRFEAAHGVAGRARHPDGGDVQRRLRRERRERRAGRHRARGHVRRQVRQRPAAGRLEARAPDLADLQLPLCAHARGAAGPGQGRPARRLPRLQAALCQSGQRRRADRHHGHLHAAPAQGFRDARPTAAPTARSSRWSKARARA